jgi:hypothetical protein
MFSMVVVLRYTIRHAKNSTNCLKNTLPEGGIRQCAVILGGRW